MKKIFALTLVFLLALSLLAACSTEKEQTDTPESNSAEKVYKIADYYNADGGFSALGLALPEENSEKVLTVSAGDTLIVGNDKYSVAAESIKLSFYTQPSLDQVIEWWTNYCEGLVGSGQLKDKS